MLESEYQKVASLPYAQRLGHFADLTKNHDELVTTTFEEQDGFTVATQNGATLHFPSPLPRRKYEHISVGYVEWLERKYSLPGFVEVEANDLTIDCGSFVGGFSVAAAQKGASVISFEPGAINVECVRRNMAGIEGCSVEQMGLYSKTDTMLLNISESAVEHSLLEPDDGDIVEQTGVKVTRLDDYLKEKNINRIDFLKLEAEGVEPEILDGLGDIKPRKLAIDISPERGGVSPLEHFRRVLPPLGYKLKTRRNVLFARPVLDKLYPTHGESSD
jgi:FkbM family methyltransferase